MFDLKVITAVFVTLLGIAIGMSQGALDKGDLNDFSGLLEDIRSSPGKLIDLITGKSEMNATIRLQVEVESIPYFKKEFSRPVGELKLKYGFPNSDFYINGAEFSSKQKMVSISVKDYRGTLDIDENLGVKGSANYVSFGDFVFNSSSVRIETNDLEAEKIEVKELPITSFAFEDIEGVVKLFNKNDVSFRNETVRLMGFKGDLEINFEEDKLYMEGKASEVSVGGNERNIYISG